MPQCHGLTRNGTPCTRQTNNQNGFCTSHQNQFQPQQQPQVQQHQPQQQPQQQLPQVQQPQTETIIEKISNWVYPGAALFLEISAVIVLIYGFFVFLAPYLNPYLCARSLASGTFLSYSPPVPNYLKTSQHFSLKNMLRSYKPNYIVVIGPRGSGKSTLVNQVIAEEKFGVVALTLEKDRTLYESLMSKVCDNPVVGINPAVSLLSRTIDIVKQKNDPEIVPNWVPTIVVEVERGASNESIRATATHLKLMCIDKRVCRGVIILSDAAAAIYLPPEESRIVYFWVDDFNESVASLYFDERKAFLVDESMEGRNNLAIRKRIFSTIGTRPMELESVIEAKENRADIMLYLNEKLMRCQSILQVLFGLEGFPPGSAFKDVSERILNSSEKFIAHRSLSIDHPLSQFPKATLVLQDHHALMFHIPTLSYRFQSQCYEIAARELINNPISTCNI